MSYRTMVRLLSVLAATLALACGSSTDPGVNAHVRFVVDAPFCGNAFPVNFFIDNVYVGRDTLWFGVGGDTSAVTIPGFQRFRAYRSFGVQAGSHTVRAILVDTITSSVLIHSWPDTNVSVAGGAEVVRKLPFYCS
jgi:hypothetical protein